MLQSPNPSDIGDVPPGGIGQKPGGDAAGHQDEKRKELPRNLSMHQFYEVKRLIEQEKEEELLHVKEDGNDKGPVNLMMDPVLNVVIACGKTDLAIRLISKLDPEKLEKENYVGDTALHVAAAKNDHRVSKKLVAKNSGLVELLNKKLETALHKAALNGHRDLFWWLVDEGKSNPQARRKDGATVLHCAVMGNAPVLALEIAKQYDTLIMSRNENAVTPLLLMVTVPDLFASQLEHGSLDRLIYKLSPIEVDEATMKRRRRQGDQEEAASAEATQYDGAIEVADDDRFWQIIHTKFPPNYSTFLDLLEFITTIPVDWSRAILLNLLRPVFPRIKKLEEEKKKHREAMELTAYLADLKYMEFHQLGRTGDERAAGGFPAASASPRPAQQTTTARWNEPPLILGAQMGLHDFVKKILQVCPQSVVFPDTKGRSVVRVAIESGSKEILDVISRMADGENPTLPSWLFSDIDHETGNTILHFAAVKGYVHGGRGEEEIKRDGDDDGKETSHPEKPEGGNKEKLYDQLKKIYELLEEQFKQLKVRPSSQKGVTADEGHAEGDATGSQEEHKSRGEVQGTVHSMETTRPEKPQGENRDKLDDQLLKKQIKQLTLSLQKGLKADQDHAEGDAIRLQDEIMWFDKVRGMIPDELVYSRNKEEKTAREVFIESHRDMFNNCKNQLMDLGKTCSGLLAAVVFASSFSIPGEKDPKTELPIYYGRLPFTLFSHAYPIGFSCATTSLVLFLSLTTSPYKLQQFRWAVPTKYLLACLAFMITLVAFLVSFSCNIFLQIYGGRITDKKHVVMMLLELTVFPIICFLILLFRGCHFLPSFLRRTWPF